ncbi:hypothetical protein TSPI_10723 [Trichinella spiralis]|uniref:Uncharacterized protein n=1 Tax=Trichinella spiralis TaxID=6334 RepID=A0ABR3KIH1_TRISP
MGEIIKFNNNNSGSSSNLFGGSFGKHSCSGYMCSVILARCKLIINSNIWKNTLAQKLWSFRAGTWLCLFGFVSIIGVFISK